MAVLRIGGQQQLPLLTDRVAIGSAPGCDVVIESPSVAEHHATLVRTEFGWLVIDETGRAGVSVDGQPVRNHFLRTAQTITLGEVEVAFDPDVESSAPTIPGNDAPSSTPTVPGDVDGQTGATIVPGQTLVPDRPPRRFEPPPAHRRTLLQGSSSFTPPGQASPVPPPPPSAALTEDGAGPVPSSATIPAEADPSSTETLTGSPDETSDTLVALEDPPPVAPNAEATAATNDRAAPTHIEPDETPAPVAAELEPEVAVGPSSRYLLGDEPALGGGPVRLGTGSTGSGAYSLGEANTVAGAQKPPVRFEMGDAARRPPSVYELGDTAPAPGRDRPRDDGFTAGGLPFAKTDPSGAGSSRSIYTMGDAAPHQRPDVPPVRAELEAYALGSGAGGGGDFEARQPAVQSSASVYSIGPAAPSASVRSSPSTYTLGSPGPPAAASVGPRRPAPTERTAPSPAQSWSWVDADPRGGGRAALRRGRGLIAVGFAFVLLGGILVGLSFLLGMHVDHILGVIGGGR